MNNIAPHYPEYVLEQLKRETIDIIKLSLKRLTKGKSGNIVNLYSSSYKPKLLLLGSDKSGKNSIIETLSSNATDILTVDNHECRAIVNNDQVVFNIPGEFSTNENTISYWQEIFKLLAKSNPTNPFDGIIISLNLHQLIHSPKATKYKFNLHLQNILHLASHSLKRSIPIYILITHMDTLIGFNEFFKDLSSEDLDDIWGLELPSVIKPSLLDVELTDSFKNMQVKLENRLHWRLNTLASPKDVSLAYEFPLQFRSIQTFITNNLKQIISNDILQKFNISGVFFISDNQTNKKTDCLIQYTKKILSLNLMLDTKSTPANSTPFFIKNLLLDKIPKQTKKYLPSTNIVTKYIKTKFFIWLSSILFISLIIFSLSTFRNDITNIKNINSKLFDYRIQLHKLAQKDYQLQELIKLLNIIASIDEQFSGLNVEKVITSLLPNSTNIKSSLDNLHAKTNQKILFPFIQRELENDLRLAIRSNNPSKIFNSTKSYLMLNVSTNFDSEYIVNRVTRILGSNPFLETKNILQLHPLIKKALAKSPLLPLNQKLISQAKKLLVMQPFADLVYTLFKDHILDSPIKNTGLYSRPLFIPSYLKSVNFVNYFENLIPTLCEDFISFYNKLAQPHFDLKSLIQAVQHEYIQEYALYWKTYLASLLPNTQINSTDSIDDALHRLHTSMHYIGTATKLIEENTRPLLSSSNTANLFNHFIADKLQEDTKHFQIADESFAPTFNKIQKYHDRLKNSHNQSELIFNEVSKVFNNNKDNIFEGILANKPSKILTLNNWLYEFGRSLWEHHLLQAEKHIHTKWQQEIYPEFMKNFDQKYPLKKTSTKDASLQDFTNFFGANGKLANFYRKYIYPFYRTEQANWSQITKFNFKPHFTELVPEIFIKSQLIQTMYFDDNRLSVPFSLTPIRIEPIIKKVELVINGYKVVYKHNRQTSLPLEWPFESQTVHLMFETIHHRQASDIFNSEWGFFKLLDKAEISPINQHEYQLLFKLNNNAVAFSLALKKQINPLTEGIIENFQLPKFLFKKHT